MGNSYLDDNGVPYNKFGITNNHDRLIREYELTTTKGDEILAGKVPNLHHPSIYGVEHLRGINKYLFEEMYEWAGKERTRPSSKEMDSGENMVSVFAAPSSFPEKFQALEKKTAAFASASGLTFTGKIDALTDIFIAANHIHPFPEGNGRTLQIFIQQLAREQNVTLDYTKVSAKEWSHASAISGIYGEVFKEPDDSKYLITAPSNRNAIRGIFQSMSKESLTDRSIIAHNNTAERTANNAAPKQPQKQNKKRQDYDQGS